MSTIERFHCTHVVASRLSVELPLRRVDAVEIGVQCICDISTMQAVRTYQFASSITTNKAPQCCLAQPWPRGEVPRLECFWRKRGASKEN